MHAWGDTIFIHVQSQWQSGGIFPRLLNPDRRPLHEYNCWIYSRFLAHESLYIHFPLDQRVKIADPGERVLKSKTETIETNEKQVIFQALFLSFTLTKVAEIERVEHTWPQQRDAKRVQKRSNSSVRAWVSAWFCTRAQLVCEVRAGKTDKNQFCSDRSGCFFSVLQHFAAKSRNQELQQLLREHAKLIQEVQDMEIRVESSNKENATMPPTVHTTEKWTAWKNFMWGLTCTRQWWKICVEVMALQFTV